MEKGVEMQQQNIEVKYFDVKGNETKYAKNAVKSEVYHYGDNHVLDKIEYYHLKNFPKSKEFQPVSV